ncbi:hypothetical protein PhCBS80983_g05221 [Powellomyces hirtus]|uniref:Mitochondrial carrier domain-containing protein n=1 Tax=Powellomyces hirtus TaxID=109895 RepID=A0A507DVQ2_9FUNG|nr:hypothetical protein PhCBS80983_g05221 [Powellomyces hirtus]
MSPAPPAAAGPFVSTPLHRTAENNVPSPSPTTTTAAATTTTTTEASAPCVERVSLADMDTTKYAAFGSIFILAVDSTLFPLDTVKTVVMSQRGTPFGTTSVYRTARNLLRAEGLARFWRGLLPAVTGSFPGQALYYVAYESAQDACADSPQIAASPFLRGFLAGAAAELSAGLCYVPADVVAQRLQVQNVMGFAHNSR